MSTKEFMVPDLGEGLEELTIIRWLAAPGDHVTLNQPLCLVETAKAEVEIPSPHDGTLQSTGGGEGETLLVGSLLARFDVGGGDDNGEAAAAPTTRQPTLVGYGHDESIDRSRRRRSTAQRTETAQALQETVEVAASSPAPVPPGSPAVSAAPTGSGTTGRPRAKPPVRKLAKDLGVDLAGLGAGTGAGGTITREQVRAAAHQGATSAAAATPAPAGSAAAAAGQVIPVTGIRARIGARMSQSRQQIPDASCSVVADFTRLIEVRARLNTAAERRGHAATITPFSLVAYMAVQALIENPILNATYVDNVPEIKLHPAVHLGIGTATERGLVVAVVKDASSRSVLSLSKEMVALAEAARGGTLAGALMVGSTFTISNFGALGLDEGVPVINHPEAAILGVGAVKPRPHVVDGEVVARPTGNLTLAFDHRVCDGAEAGRFLTQLREMVEHPEIALLGS
jgi:pyruvate dehydrogenase E2 component (dihydrolipoamide acetyltransferase)